MDGCLQLHPGDNVAVALHDLPAGQVTCGTTLREPIPQGHKFALRAIPAGQPVVKYGYPIGRATADIPPGAWVHTHNTETGLSGVEAYRYEPEDHRLSPRSPDVFWGFPRADRRAGTRNELWILPTVGCVNGVAGRIERAAQGLVGEGVEGVYAFPHPHGCSQMGEDLARTQRALLRLIRHPNAAGVLLLSLGCEYIQPGDIRAQLTAEERRRVRTLTCQDTQDEVGDALAALSDLAREARACRRQQVPVSELVVGLKCGGSDGLSGITANPLVGRISDRLAAQGATPILTEVAEMFGAEGLLLNRCVNEAVFRRAVAMLDGVKRDLLSRGLVLYENPSPGNKAGGITTLEDKSLGCTQKGGTAEITDVLSYGQPATTPGLGLLDCPSNDLVAANGQVLSGAQLVLFTTGRGTPFGCPVPTIKIATNTPLYEKKPDWLDFNAGVLAEGADWEETVAAFYAAVLRVASGERTAAERAGFRDLVLWKDGVTL